VLVVGVLRGPVKMWLGKVMKCRILEISVAEIQGVGVEEIKSRAH
jgi:hypothetical protein